MVILAFSVTAAALGSARLADGCGALAPQDSEHSHQQKEPLKLTDVTLKTSIGDRLEEVDQISRCKLINCTGTDLGHGKRIDPPTRPNADRVSKSFRILCGPVQWL